MNLNLDQNNDVERMILGFLIEEIIPSETFLQRNYFVHRNSLL